MGKNNKLAIAVACAACVSAVISLCMLANGFSPFDDGAYAWGLQALAKGGVLHRDVPWPHPGYVLWLILPFSDFLSEDILHYRYPLPVMAALTAAGFAYLLRRQGASVMIVSGVIVGALGFAQFSSYSASWFAVCAMVLGVAFIDRALACGHGRQWLWGVSSGFMAGLAFGFRGPNGVAALACVMAIVVLAEAERPQGCGRGLNRLFAGGMLVFVAGVAGLADEPDRAYAALPAIAAGLLVVLGVLRAGDMGWPRLLWWIAAGFVLALLPLLAWALVQGAMGALLHDMVALPASISRGAGSSRTDSYEALLSQAIGVFLNPSGWRDAVTALVFLFTALMPLLMLAMVRKGKGMTPMWMLAAFSFVGVMVHPGMIYACYVWPFVMAAILEKATRKRLACVIGVLVCLVFLFVTPCGLYPGNQGLLSDQFGFSNWVGTADLLREKCPLPKCSVHGDARTMRNFGKNVEALRAGVLSDEPLLVLPTSAEYAFFLNNPMPFSLNRYDFRLGDAAGFRRDFMSDPKLVIAIRNGEADKYTEVIAGCHRRGGNDRWEFWVGCEGT